MARTVVIGASSGLGRCIGVGLAKRGEQVALLARRRERIDAAAEESGAGAIAIECDVTDEQSCRSAIEEAADAMGGIDNLVYTPGIGPLVRLIDTDAQTWRRVFETNVTGAATYDGGGDAAPDEIGGQGGLPVVGHTAASRRRGPASARMRSARPRSKSSSKRGAASRQASGSRA